MDPNLILGVASLILFIAFIGYFGYVIYHQQQVDPDEKPVYGVELLEQHYAPGDTVEQPTPYWVAQIPAAPDPLEISSNLDRKIVAAGADILVSGSAIFSSRDYGATITAMRQAGQSPAKTSRTAAKR